MSATLPRTPTRMRPLNDRIVIKPDPPKTQSSGGVILPDTHEDKDYARSGLVLAVGPGRWEHGARTPMDVKVGDVVRFTPYGGSSVKVDEFEVLIIGERDVLVVDVYE